jgi:hypothetical protein
MGELAPWLIITSLLVAFGSFGVWVNTVTNPIQDDRYLQLQKDGQLPPGAVSENSHVFGFWSSIMEIVLGIVIAFFVLLPVALSLIRTAPVDAWLKRSQQRSKD